jgi:hypothetical protein
LTFKADELFITSVKEFSPYKYEKEFGVNVAGVLLKN